MNKFKCLSGTQAKLVGAALTTVGCAIFTRMTGVYLDAGVGGALSVILVTALDVFLAGGEPTDPDPKP